MLRSYQNSYNASELWYKQSNCTESRLQASRGQLVSMETSFFLSDKEMEAKTRDENLTMWKLEIAYSIPAVDSLETQQ